MQHIEAQHQKSLIRWAKIQEKIYPDLKMLFAINNGGFKVSIRTAVNLKQSGVKAGVPDLFLAVPTKKYHGLFIELKVGKNKTSENQDLWIEALNTYKFRAVVCHGWLSARDTIIDYLDLPYP